MGTRVAWIILKCICFSVLLAVVFDLFMIQVVQEDIRTQIYMAGHYVSTMAADPTELASGNTNQPDLYKDEDILKEFEKFVRSTYLDSTSTISKNTSSKTASFTINKFGVKRVNHINTRADIITHGGVKGVRITIEYVLNPFSASFFGKSLQKFAVFRIPMTRNFRILGA